MQQCCNGHYVAIHQKSISQNIGAAIPLNPESCEEEHDIMPHGRGSALS